MRSPGDEVARMEVFLAGDAVQLPVRLHGIGLGRPVDVLVDVESWRALGLEVHCGDDTRRFLPFGAALVGAAEIDVTSSLMLLDDVAFYRKRGESLRSLRGAPVERAGRRLGALRDLALRPDGAVDAIVLDRGPRVTPSADVRIVSATPVSAA